MGWVFEIVRGASASICIGVCCEPYFDVFESGLRWMCVVRALLVDDLFMYVLCHGLSHDVSMTALN